MLLISGASSVPLADALVEKIRPALDEAVELTRPIICVALRILGLDDSIMTAEIASAIIRDEGSALV